MLPKSKERELDKMSVRSLPPGAGFFWVLWVPRLRVHQQSMKAGTDVGDECTKTFTEWFMLFLAGVNAHAAEVARVKFPPSLILFTDLKASEWGGNSMKCLEDFF